MTRHDIDDDFFQIKMFRVLTGSMMGHGMWVTGQQVIIVSLGILSSILEILPDKPRGEGGGRAFTECVYPYTGTDRCRIAVDSMTCCKLGVKRASSMPTQDASWVHVTRGCDCLGICSC